MIINHGISVCSMKVIGRKKNLADNVVGEFFVYWPVTMDD